MDGVINIYKEKGFTSHDVVAKLRGILKQKKIGHTGTLDPDAVGVLPVCLGKATKLCDMLTDTTKEYRTVLRLGAETDTQDMTGTVLAERPVNCTLEQVRETVFSFLGPYEQIPPMYSALKVNGQKLCDLARQGKTVERKSRAVEIFSIEVHRLELPHVEMTVSCSKGTYIRTLCHDIGQALGCGGAMEELIRTRSGRFRLEEALTLSQVEELRDAGTLPERILPVERMFDHLPEYRCEEAQEKVLRNGNPLQICGGSLEAGEYRVRDSFGNFVGIYRYLPEEGVLKPRKLFFVS